MERRVVITGMGIWSCLGQNLNEVKESLYAGRSGIGVERERLDYGYRSGLTGLVPRPQLKGVIDRRLRVGLSEEAEYAYMASRQAFEQSLMDEAYLRETRWASSSATTPRPNRSSRRPASWMRSTTRRCSARG